MTIDTFSVTDTVFLKFVEKLHIALVEHITPPPGQFRIYKVLELKIFRDEDHDHMGKYTNYYAIVIITSELTERSNKTEV